MNNVNFNKDKFLIASYHLFFIYFVIKNFNYYYKSIDDGESPLSLYSYPALALLSLLLFTLMVWCIDATFQNRKFSFTSYRNLWTFKVNPILNAQSAILFAVLCLVPPLFFPFEYSTNESYAIQVASHIYTSYVLVVIIQSEEKERGV